MKLDHALASRNCFGSLPPERTRQRRNAIESRDFFIEAQHRVGLDARRTPGVPSVRVGALACPDDGVSIDQEPHDI
jgi:hypothetical protein